MIGTSIVTFTPMDCVKNGFFINQSIEFKKFSSSYSIFEDGDIVLAKVTPCFENGNIAIAKNLYNKLGFGSSELYVLRCCNANVKFMFYYFQNNIFKDMATSTMYGAGGLKRVSPEFISENKIPFPPLPAQIAIANYLDTKTAHIDSAIAKKETLIHKLAEYKKSLIYESVTGKREV